MPFSSTPAQLSEARRVHLYIKAPRSLTPSPPLVLDSLKSLVCSPAQSFLEIVSATRLAIPVIECLELDETEGLEFFPFTAFCHQISASLESLILRSFGLPEWSITELEEFFTFPIPTLRRLSLAEWPHTAILNAMCALTPGEGEDGYKNRCLPNLEYLSIHNDGGGVGLYYDFDIRVLELVKGRRIGEDSPFHLDFSFARDDSGTQATWKPELMKEFKEFVANRRIEVTVRGRKAELDPLSNFF